MMQDYSQAYAFIAALAGDPATAQVDFRAIHDKDKAVAAIPFRGTLPECWPSICRYNDAGYGLFATVNAMDGQGRLLANVQSVRAHFVDLDNLSARQNYERAAAAHPAPGFGVCSSPGKYHVYWPVAPYAGIERFQTVQRKLKQVFDSDPKVIDATRVMRLPGTTNNKYDVPYDVTCHSLAGYGQPTTIEALETALASVQVIEGGYGQRQDLGTPELAAPSLEWVKTAFQLTDPNALDRSEWISFTAAIKQAMWSHTDPDTALQMWSEWCARYEANDPGENLKQWNNLQTTELGWRSVVARTPSLKAMLILGGVDHSSGVPGATPVPGEAAPVPPMPEPSPLDCSGPVLTDLEQREWFKGCVYVINLGEMMTGNGRFLNSGQFNVAYGGKLFVINDGKTTDEAWKAATRSSLWTVPKVDHIRFIPSRAYGEEIDDDHGRTGINTYRPIRITRKQGDPGPFLRHIAALLPVPGDQKILLDYLAHNAKFPGFKIPWAPVIQSAEGAGKGVLKLVMSHLMGRSYTYFPNAKELGSSGSQFNAWMRRKLFILADEIKVDDRRDLIEVLKPMISEELIEIQGKGVDQELEDNFANWLFFTNWQDAIPVNANGRRFSIFYSVLQKAEDMLERQMGEAYFKALYSWLKGEDGYEHGAAIVADYLLNYPIERGAIPMRAPDTSSTARAISLSRTPLERMVVDAVADALPGFRGGWISSLAVINRAKALQVTQRAPTGQTVATLLEGMGYTDCGRALRPFFNEDREIKAQLFHAPGRADVAGYGAAQGYAEAP